MSKSAINENALFSKISSFFSNPNIAVKEIIQNSRRANASEVYITLESGNVNTATFIDNGSGIKSFRKLLTLSESDWSKEIEVSENPAGWGFYSALSVSKKVKVRNIMETESDNKFLEIETERFFTDENYRSCIFDQCDIIDSKKDIKFLGVEICLEINDSVFNDFTSFCGYNLKFYEFKDITIKIISGKNINITKETGIVLDPETEILPGVFLIKHDEKISNSFVHNFDVVFNGERIGTSFYASNILFVKDNSVIKPVLPFREKIKEIPKEKERELLYAVNLHKYKESLKKLKTFCTENLCIKYPSKIDEYAYVFEKFCEFNSYVKKEDKADLNFLNFYVKKNFEEHKSLNKRSMRGSKGDLFNHGYMIITKDCKEFFPIAKNTLVDSDSGINFYNEELKNAKVCENFFYPDSNFPKWIFEREEELRKKIKINIFNFSVREIQEKAGKDVIYGENLYIYFLKKEIVDFKKNIFFAQDEYECQNVSLYLNKEDFSKEDLKELLLNNNIFENFIYYDGEESDTYYTQEDHYKDSVEDTLEEAYPKKKTAEDLFSDNFKTHYFKNEDGFRVSSIILGDCDDKGNYTTVTIGYVDGSNATIKMEEM